MRGSFKHLLEILLEKRGQFPGVCDCQVGEYVNHLITNYSLRRAFKYIASKISRDSKCTILCKTQNKKPFSKYVIYLREFPTLNMFSRKSNLLLTQVPVPSMFLSEWIFMQKQQDNGKQVFQSELKFHKNTKEIALYFVPVPSCSFHGLLQVPPWAPFLGTTSQFWFVHDT